MSVADERAAYSEMKLEELTEILQRQLGDDAEKVLGENTCIYVVGSLGRGEMSEHSDVDSFVARVGGKPLKEDESRIRDAITRTFAELTLPPPSREGVFLKMHSDKSLCAFMGDPKDDFKNTLTARMLLLLESKPVLGPAPYERLVERVVDAYWKNAGGHSNDYMPFVLVNDIVRYWRILLLNYEHKNSEKERELSQETRDAERRLRSYKLRFSRCMMCFSFLIGLLGIAAKKGNVTRDDVRSLVKSSPRERLLGLGIAEVEDKAEALLGLYDGFLEQTAHPKSELVKRFADEGFRKDRASEGRMFGDKVFELLQALGRSPKACELYRYMVV